jgi:threonine/homoserine/homoserine lactone efflux protein
MTPELISAFALFALISSITPGPNNLMLMASGTNFGFARSIPHALGVTAGFILMVLLVGLGLAQIFAAYPFVHDVLKVLCAIYLIYLAWKIATSAPPKEGEARGEPMTFVQAALFQWVNPKAWTMALTAVSTYAPEHAPFQTLALIAILFGIINLPSTSVWTLMGVQLRRLLQNPRALRVFNVGAALALVASLVPAFSASG